MYYQSTRDKNARLTAAEAIAQGLARDGGLFVPESIPSLPDGAIKELCAMGYKERAGYIMSMYLDGFTRDELAEFCDSAYSDNFDVPEVAPVLSLDRKTHFLELWHGPTCAFKDMALQMLPYLLTASLDKTGDKRQVCMLVATSGDTGKAALEGFRDVPRTKIFVFYPKDGVSDVQQLQMTTQYGENVGVCAVHGNFDDAQTGVKKIFSDETLRTELDGRGYFLSSANSINWGRLLPQVVYYISAYCDLVNSGAIGLGDEIEFCVPTGNFGDILAGWYAKRMGLPVKKLICASNRNDVLTEFIRTGVYNKNRRFYTTVSPSMDILVSSNLERLLFELSGKDDVLVASYMDALFTKGIYTVTDAVKEAVSDEFACGCCSEEETKATIADVMKKHGYLIDTHTAVAAAVLEKYRNETGDMTPAVVVSTASPYKFSSAVLSALGQPTDMDGFEQIELLSSVTGTRAPAPLASLKGRPVRFEGSVNKEDMLATVDSFLS